MSLYVILIIQGNSLKCLSPQHFANMTAIRWNFVMDIMQRGVGHDQYHIHESFHTPADASPIEIAKNPLSSH